MAEGDGATAAHEGGSSAHRHESLLGCKHPVFLSHSGAQKNFVRQLCLDIERYDRYPFFDKRRDSLSIGCNFPDEIFRAIKECHVAVVVLSEDFFTRSKWPMLELAALVKRKRGDCKLIIMPVYLGMTNAQCWDKSNQERWLRVWQTWAKGDSRINLGEWRETLRMFGYTNGIFLNDERDEVKCRREIVEAVCKEVPPRTRWDDSHVQGRSRLVSAIRAKIGGMEASKSYGGRILGVYGVGGVGKTTICKVLCNEYFEEFEGKVCHIEFGIGNRLQRLQEVLKRLTKTNHELIRGFSEDECKDRMKKDLLKRVFLAIDNVSGSHHIVDEVKGLLGMGLRQECIVIVTARSRDLLCNMNLEECMEMPDLDEEDARLLLFYEAAPGSYLRNADAMSRQLLKQCIKRCYFGKGVGGRYHYHPLALKVLGGQLGNDPTTWMEKLKGVDPFNQYEEEGKDHPIFSILGRSFEMLRQDYQLLFMDVALFLPRIKFDKINIFEWLSMVHGKSVAIIKQKLEGLKSKSLVESLGDGSEEIGMHDLWREFAIMKSNGEEFDSRLWFCKHIYSHDDPKREEPNLSRGNGWERLQSICMFGSSVRKWCVVEGIDLSCYSSLRVLKLVDIYIATRVLDVSSLRELKSLQVVYPFGSVGILEFVGLGLLRSLVFLHFERMSIQTTLLDEEVKGLTSLRVLHIVKVDSSSGFPDFRRLNSLRDVVFHNFGEADMISARSSNMTNLKRLRLSECYSLSSCHGVDDLVALEELNLSRCSKLRELSYLGRLKHLLKLDISRCSLIEGVPGFGDLVSLREFRAYACDRLAVLPDMRKLVKLRVLRLSCCPLMKAIPGLGDVVALESLDADFEGLQGCDDLRKLVKLERVRIRGWGAEGVPCLSDLVSLKALLIESGKSGLDGLSSVRGIQVLHIRACADIVGIPCLSNLTSLTSLSVKECGKLERLPDMHRLSSLETLKVSWCESLRVWGGGSGLRPSGVDQCVSGPILPQLQRLELRVVGFAELPDLSRFPQLRELEISGCDELTSLTSSAPLTALHHLSLGHCKRLRALPDVDHLVSLNSFILDGCVELKLRVDEIVKLEAMCPWLELDRSRLSKETA